jgi:transcriptional regulator with XRE-family HTH domain
MRYRFGEKIRAVRERRSLTLKDVAERAGVSESLVSQIERNRVSPAIDTLLSLADALDIDLEYLFSDYRKERSVRVLLVARSRTSSTRPACSTKTRQLDGEGQGRHGIEAYYITLEPGREDGRHGIRPPRLRARDRPGGPGRTDRRGEELRPRGRRFGPFRADFPLVLANAGPGVLKVSGSSRPQGASNVTGVRHGKTTAEKIFDTLTVTGRSARRGC